ncbi:MAG: hypothetical protein AAFY48_14395 [Bacteroidota bacterium]
MKYLSYLTCLALALLTTGCFEMLEDLYVNADGSGKYQITIDMSGMFSDPFMGEMMKQGLQEETGGESLEIDSLLTFTDLSDGELPPSLTDKDRDILNRTELRMQMSESEEIGKFTISFPFASFDELNEFNKTLAKMNEEGGQGGGMSGLMSGSTGFTGNESLWDLSGRTLTRKVITSDPAELMEEMGGEEMMDMVKMMMADATFTSTYHLPGRVKKCTIPNAEVDGKNVSVSYNFLDAFEDEVPETGGTIKFKKN